MLPLQVCVHVWPNPSVNDLHVLNLVKAAVYLNPTAPAPPSLLLLSLRLLASSHGIIAIIKPQHVQKDLTIETIFFS